MRILHAVRSDGFAGVERHVARLARAQSAAGHQVVVVGGDVAAVRATLDAGPGGVPVRAPVPVPVLPAATTGDVARALARHARGADVVHVHMTAAEVAASLALLAPDLLRRGTPVVSTRHFARPRGSGTAGRAVAAVARRPVRAQVAISRYVAAHVDGPSTVVHPGVDDRPDGLPAASRDRTVLVVQRLEPEKRTADAVRAFAGSGLAAGGWRLDVVGDGSLRADLERLVADLGTADPVVAGAVRFLGARGDVEDRMSRAGLLLAPCAVEGLGLSVLEAMAAGLPVVASAAGGHLELLEDVDPAALWAPGDVGAAGAALAALAASPDRRDRAARRAVARQREEFTAAAQVRATDAVYAQVLR